MGEVVKDPRLDGDEFGDVFESLHRGGGEAISVVILEVMLAHGRHSGQPERR